MALLFIFKNYPVIFYLAAIYFLIKGIIAIRKKSKKPLVFTARAKRLYGTSIVLIIIIALIAYFTTDIGYTIICLTGATVLSFGILLVSNILLIPCEKSVNRWYYNDAKRILNSMPDLTIIGITGSYGKTSTKHFLHTILSEKYNVLMTPGSYNTTLGVIRTIREQLKSYHNIFIVEMEQNKPETLKKSAT
ncbi:MAG: Mur ligase family protein [Odoribacter sp.]